MLILTRKVGEKIIIGDDLINIKILKINGSQVMIGIDAPKDISVHREEVYTRIKDQEEV